MELMNIENYSQYKTELDAEINKTANSFCKIGYLLKLARDTDILKESGYSSYTEFAKAEYGLDKSQVSRFIAINDRFSIEGNSEQIEDKYAEYGSAKLSIMLTLPDEIVEELDPSYSKADIQAIKEEYDEEKNISDIEVLMEPAPAAVETSGDEFIAQIIKQLNDDNEEEARDVAMGKDISLEDIKGIYAPDGSRAYTIRISGTGRFSIMMKPDSICIINMRDNTKSPLSWEEFEAALWEDLKDRTFEPVKPVTKEEARIKKPKVKKAAKSQEAKAPVEDKNVSTEPKDEPEEPVTQGQNKEILAIPLASLTVPHNTTAASQESEEKIIESLNKLMYCNPGELCKEIKAYGNYRETLDTVSEWTATVNNKVNELYKILHERSM